MTPELWMLGSLTLSKSTTRYSLHSQVCGGRLVLTVGLVVLAFRSNAGADALRAICPVFHEPPTLAHLSGTSVYVQCLAHVH